MARMIRMWLVLLILLTRPIITIMIFIWQICLHSSQTDNSIRFAMEGIHSLMNSKYAIDFVRSWRKEIERSTDIFVAKQRRQRERQSGWWFLVSRLDKNGSSTFPGYNLITFSFKKNFLLHSVKLIFSEIKTKIQNMGPFVPIFSWRCWQVWHDKYFHGNRNS